MHNRCQRGRFAVPGAVVARFARTIRGSSPRSSAWSSPRRWAIHAALDLGVEEHGEACRNPDADGHPISADSVRTELVKLGFSRQSNRKADEGSKHPDRNAQFEYISAKVIAAQAQQQPVISVDTKKKELVGNFKNGGTDYRPKGDPQRVNVHDFEDKKLGKVVPYGVYDVTANTGFVSVGITSDTAEFAVQSIRCWLERMGRQRYPNPRELTVTADCGGSNGARVRLWKLELQKAGRRDRARDSASTTIRPAHRNGTRSSTGCSVTSRRTGAAGRLRIALPWSS